MESYSFVNIFESKGEEYLLVIAFLLLFVRFVIYLGLTGKGEGHRPPAATKPAQHSPKTDSPGR